MIPRHRILLCLIPSLLVWNGCSSVSKLTSSYSEKRANAAKARNPEQMRIGTDTALFQPIVRVDVPQFSGLQTPLAGGNRRRTSASEGTRSLTRFTPVKVLSNNGRAAFVQLNDGARGYVPSACISTESAILATAKPATLADQPAFAVTDPATGKPYDPQGLYLPTMDATDAPVDQAMLNNIDSIPLPESEVNTVHTPEGQEVDGIVIRSPSADASASLPQ